MRKLAKKFAPVYVNDNSALVPEIWSMETLLVLDETRVASKLVNSDYSKDIQSYGQYVNASKPRKLTASRRKANDTLDTSDVGMDASQVKLDQWNIQSFIIGDHEASLSIKDLVKTHLRPAAISLAQDLDRIILGTAFAFRSKTIGKLGTAINFATLVEARRQLRSANMDPLGMPFLTGAYGEADITSITQFHDLSVSGDAGIVTNGLIGRKLGFNYYVASNAIEIEGAPYVTGSADNAAVINAGDTSFTKDAAAIASLVVGCWVVVSGEDQPMRVTAIAGDLITVDVPFRNTLAANANFKVYGSVTINLPAGYNVGHVKALTIAGTIVPGQVLSSADGVTYGTLDGSGLNTVRLSQPVASNLANGAKLFYAPNGKYSMVFMREAISFVNRPLVQVEAGAGAKCHIAQDPDIGLAVRATISYDSTAQGHRVTLDLLSGVQVIDSDLGALVLH